VVRPVGGGGVGRGFLGRRACGWVCVGGSGWSGWPLALGFVGGACGFVGGSWLVVGRCGLGWLGLWLGVGARGGRGGGGGGCG